MPAKSPPTVPPDDALAGLVERLCRESINEYEPFSSFDDWPATLDRSQWFMSEQVVSLHGTAIWQDLDAPTRRMVSFWDAVAFFSANIHGETGLMRGLTARLNAPGHEKVTPYLHHMLDEENKHSVYFTEFCRRYGGRVYPDRMLTLSPDPEELSDFLFFARVYLFEDIVDCINAVVAADPAVHPIARWINAHHHHEERRHLAFGRSMVRRLWSAGQEAWSPSLIEHAQVALAGFLTATWKSFYSPQVYLDAGLPDPWTLAVLAYDSPQARSRRAVLSRRSVNFLTRSGMLTHPVSL